MTISAFDSVLAQELRTKIGAEIARQTEIVVLGTLKSFEDYRSVTGRLAGMSLALSILSELENRMSTPSAPPKAHIRNIG